VTNAESRTILLSDEIEDAMPTITTTTTIRGKGQVTIPAEIRDAAHLEEGTVLEVTVAEDGVVEMRAKVLVPAEDAWFWSSGWQKGEREAEAQIKAGEVEVFSSDEDFLAAVRGK
jgi:AbrB family looped-hinge helix DNA binding protein